MIIVEIIFWTGIGCMFHTYILFPLLIRILKGGRKNNNEVFSREELPPVTIIMAAYNEERVIAQKLQSILDCDYPKEKVKIVVGSDNSTDLTDAIVKSFSEKFPFVISKRFKSRTGKIIIVNEIINKVADDFIIITDANVIFDSNTIFDLVKHFKNPKIGLVDSNMINLGMRKAGISHQEKTYIQTEVGTKQAESIVWGCMMGPFGGCYALRKILFRPVPENFLVDDFYINMKVLEQNYKCINETGALVYEDVSNNLLEEYRRKVRIATGNFQNLFSFRKLLLKGKGIGFCFFSHKVLRWLGPIFLLLIFISSALLFQVQNTNNLPELFYKIAFTGIAFAFILIPVDRLLNKLGLNFWLLRFNTHFFFMNAALLRGLLKFFSGVSNSIWEPTKRHQ